MQRFSVLTGSNGERCAMDYHNGQLRFFKLNPILAALVLSAFAATLVAQHVPCNSNPSLQNGPCGNLDGPANGASGRQGAINVTGWALSRYTVSKVSIFRDAIQGEPSGLKPVQDAPFVAGARPDVAGTYPNYPNNNWGWGTLVLTNELPDSNGDGGHGNGTYNLHVYAYDPFGASVDIGDVSIQVNNAASHTPFGTIDTPTDGGGAPGTAFVNFGWALTPQPNNIRTDGSTIWVYIDGQAVGHPVYNQYRPDIASLFPGYANTNGAVGYYIFDTTPYMPTNPDPLRPGLHTISWAVTDSANNGAGIGSRYFRV